ncbi:MAG: helix-turn-helix transcriptional regulator [Segetibacter sp.]
MNIGEKIRTIRLTKNLTQNAIAKKIGISVTALGDIERGKTKDLTVNRLAQIAKALDVSPKELLDEKDDEHNNHNNHNHDNPSKTDLIELQGQIIGA